MRHDLTSVLALFDTRTAAGALMLAIVFVIAGLVFAALMRRLLETALRHDRSERIDQITLSFLSHLAVLLIWIVMATFYAHLVPALHRLGTALLAGVSLISVVIGFAAQTTFSNIVAGVSLVLYKPFRRGDRLQVMAPTATQCETGTVEDISLGYTRLRTDDGREIIIANATMAQQTMIKLLPPAGPGHSGA